MFGDFLTAHVRRFPRPVPLHKPGACSHHRSGRAVQVAAVPQRVQSSRRPGCFRILANPSQHLFTLETYGRLFICLRSHPLRRVSGNTCLSNQSWTILHLKPDFQRSLPESVRNKQSAGFRSALKNPVLLAGVPFTSGSPHASRIGWPPLIASRSRLNSVLTEVTVAQKAKPVIPGREHAAKRFRRGQRGKQRSPENSAFESGSGLDASHGL